MGLIKSKTDEGINLLSDDGELIKINKSDIIKQEIDIVSLKKVF